MADANLDIVIRARDQATRTMGRVSSAIQKHARAIGLASTAVGAGSLFAAKNFVEAALTQQKAMSTLAEVIKNTGADWTAYEDKIKATTAALQAKTNFGDEQQMQILAKMVPILGDVDKAMAALPAVLDAASASGMDASSVANTLTRALAGQINTARSVGIEFDATASFSERLAQVMEKVGGSAEASADPVTQMGNTMGDLKETIGATLIPAITSLVRAITPIIKAVGNWIQEHQDLLKVLGPVALAIGALLTVLGPLLIMLPTLVTLGPLVGSAFTVMLGPVGLAIAAIVALTAAGIALWKNWDTVREKLSAIFKAISEAMKNVMVNPVIDGLNALIRALNSIKFSVPSWVPGLGGKSFGVNIPEIPKLQAGGIVTKPTLAMVGEAGPEAVVPLDRVGANVNITGGILVLRNEHSVQLLAREVHRLIRQENRRGVRV